MKLMVVYGCEYFSDRTKGTEPDLRYKIRIWPDQAA